jgi:zinc D-Ala-D-Ala carboxypeptidase
MLTEHFALQEFLRSQEAIRAGLTIEPTPEVVANLTRLCTDVLEPIRAALGPVSISSGYRPAWLNARIGGSKTSQHMTGCAADIHVADKTPWELACAIRNLKLAALNQCILEYPPSGWVHVSVAEPHETPKYQFLTCRLKDHRTVYSAGLSERVLV